MGETVGTTVIIPVRNEVKTIGSIVRVFDRHPETHGQVFVAIDAHTHDGTTKEVWDNGGCAFWTGKHGKGEVVFAAVDMLRRSKLISDRIILCDGDYTGLRTYHVERIMSRPGMVIGVPDWPVIDGLPNHVTEAWPRISGFRYLPQYLIPEDAHGYLLETQINLKAIANNVRVRMLPMFGLKSPFQWPMTEQRMAALEADRAWGKEHGVL